VAVEADFLVVLRVENKELKQNLHQQQKKHGKLLAREKTLESQLEHSEEQRSLLQDEMDQVIDDYKKKNRQLCEAVGESCYQGIAPDTTFYAN
jgi:chromosome segregation ATPase